MTSWDDLIAGSGLPRLEARRLAELASGRRREWLIAHGDESAPDDQAARFAAIARRRADGEPLAYLTGEREFRGRSFRVTPAVLIPRPETELLADWAIGNAPAGARVLDLGTGSGVVAITIALERPDVSVAATDVSEAALEVARANVAALCAQAAHGPAAPAPAPAATATAGTGAVPRVRLLAGAWFDALPPGERFETIVSNPPYVASTDAHLARGDLRFEPRTALTDGGDGLAALRAIVAGAPGHLVPGGTLALEHGWDQGAAARALMFDAGFVDVATLADAEGRERVTQGRRAPPPQDTGDVRVIARRIDPPTTDS